MFLYSIPILFTHMSLGSPFELLGIILFLYAIFLITVSGAGRSDSGQSWVELAGVSFYHKLLLAWSGEVRLRLVFIPFFIMINLLLFAADTMARHSLITVSSWDEIHFVLLTPIIIWTIVVWRNSANTLSRYWAAAARLMVVTVYFEYALKLLIRKDFPRIFFQCQEVVLDYAACF